MEQEDLEILVGSVKLFDLYLTDLLIRGGPEYFKRGMITAVENLYDLFDEQLKAKAIIPLIEFQFHKKITNYANRPAEQQDLWVAKRALDGIEAYALN